MHIISAIMNFYLSHAIALQNLSNEHSYKFSWILTLIEVISIRILRMRVISAIMNFYWSHAIALQKRSNERSYTFVNEALLYKIRTDLSVSNAENETLTIETRSPDVLDKFL